MIKAFVPIYRTFYQYMEKRAFARRSKQKTKTQKQGLVLSVTSIEPRLSTLHLAINRVIRNGFTPDVIEVWLDHSLNEKIPPELKSMENDGVRINFIDDIGPYTKLYYAVQRHPESAIITIDDDIFLPRGSLEELVGQSKKYPNTVICNRAKKITVDASGNPKPYREWPVMKCGTPHPCINILPLGTGSVYYPPGIFDHRFFDISLFKKLSPTGDDLWFTAMRILNGAMAYNTGFYKRREISIPKTGKYCIKYRHGQRGNNDESILRIWKELRLSSYFTQNNSHFII